jgi:hypothetical protein
VELVEAIAMIAAAQMLIYRRYFFHLGQGKTN